MGGDEFTVMLEYSTFAVDAGGVAAKIVEAVALPIPVEGKTASIGASVGSALSPADGTDARSLLVAADGAMYRAKQAGRGAYVFHDDPG